MGLHVANYNLADANLIGFASNVTGASFTIATTTTGDGFAHRVSIRNDSVNDHSAKTVTLTGTDADGYALTEIVTGPGASATVTSAGYFVTLTSAVPSATIGADTFDIGWVDEISTPTMPLNWRSESAASINIDVTGTINFTAQETFDDVFRAANPPRSSVQNSQWVAITALSAKTADTVAAAMLGATGIRLLVNSYTNTAEIRMLVNQPSNRS